MWADIKEVYYGADLDAARKIGFRDDFIYNYIRNGKNGVLKIRQIDKEDCQDLLD